MVYITLYMMLQVTTWEKKCQKKKNLHEKYSFMAGKESFGIYYLKYSPLADQWQMLILDLGFSVTSRLLLYYKQKSFSMTDASGLSRLTLMMKPERQNVSKSNGPD